MIVDSGSDYFVGLGCDAGVVGGCVGLAGCVFVVLGFTPDNTDPEEGVTPLRRTAKIDSVIDVTMKSTAE